MININSITTKKKFIISIGACSEYIIWEEGDDFCQVISALLPSRRNIWTDNFGEELLCKIILRGLAAQIKV